MNNKESFSPSGETQPNSEVLQEQEIMRMSNEDIYKLWDERGGVDNFSDDELEAIQKRLLEENARIEQELKAAGEQEALAKLKMEEGAKGAMEESASTAAESSEAIPEADSNEAPVAEATETPEAAVNQAKADAEKAKENPTIKGWINKHAKAAIALGLAAAITVGGVAGYYMNRNKDADKKVPQDQKRQEQMIDEQETMEEEKGIKDGYGEKGMWESKEKSSPLAFADAGEVAEVCENDECEMLKYAADKQVETFADYMANLPEALQPDEFKGLSIQETEAKLESLSDEEFEAVQEQFNNIIDNAFTRRVTLNGKYDNAYMRLKDPSKGVTHDNMELVKCTTTEKDLEVTEFYWVDEDGNETGSMIVKMQPVYDGDQISGYNLCMQVVNQEGSLVYANMAETEADPTNPSQPKASLESGIEGENPDTGSEDTGSEGTGSEGTGSEGTGSEGTGSEGTGSEGTGSEGTDINPKDAENLERIDDNANEDIAEDIGTDEVKVTPAPTEEVEAQTPTEKPADSEYEGTAPETVQNEPSKQAEPVQEKVSPENNYSENRGGANANEYAPVKEDKAAQEKADKAATPVSEAPVSEEAVEETLNDLGIE